MMQHPGNQVSSSSGERWMRSNELKMGHQSKIVSAIRLVFAFRVTYIINIIVYFPKRQCIVLLTLKIKRFTACDVP